MFPILRSFRQQKNTLFLQLLIKVLTPALIFFRSTTSMVSECWALSSVSNFVRAAKLFWIFCSIIGLFKRVLVWGKFSRGNRHSSLEVIKLLGDSQIDSAKVRKKYDFSYSRKPHSGLGDTKWLGNNVLRASEYRILLSHLRKNFQAAGIYKELFLRAFLLLFCEGRRVLGWFLKRPFNLSWWLKTVKRVPIQAIA